MLMLKLILTVGLIIFFGCGEGLPRGGEGAADDDLPQESLRLPDSLRTFDTFSPTDSSTAPNAPVSLEGSSRQGFDAEAGAGSGETDPAREGREDGVIETTVFPRPAAVRGIYLNAWTAGSSRRRRSLISLARQTELNTFVIDIKDATGFISHRTNVPLARDVGATEEVRIRDLAGVLDELAAAGIYPIARIVVSKDPLLTAGRPDLAIQDSAGGVWIDQDSVSWLNLHHREVWDYHVDLAAEVVGAGFPEIQWDYVRFPDAPEDLLAKAVYPGADGRTKQEAVREFLGYSREALRRKGALVTADVFGVTTSYRRDVGIGQLWEAFIDQVDVALPMVYPSHYWPGSFGFERPNAFPYEIVRRALRDAVSRSALVDGAGAVRPWLQDFSLGEPPYGAPEVRAQIQAAYDAGVTEWILWNPGSRYTQSALLPVAGLPSWLEPVMLVGGEVVPVSKRFEVLGEEGLVEEAFDGDSLFLPNLPLPSFRGGLEPGRLPAVPIPDTSGVIRPRRR